MTDPEVGAAEAVAAETAPEASSEDRYFDNFEDAARAIADDDEEEAPVAEPEAEEAEAEAEEPEAEEPETDEADPAEVDEDEADPEEEAGKLRMADYTRKTQELARERETVTQLKTEFTERTQQLQTAFQKFQQFAEGLIPPPPSLDLARQDPAAYQYQVALREAAMQEMQSVFEIGGDLENQVQGFSEAELARYRENEQAALVKAMPELKDPAKLAQFHEAATEAAKEFGFSEDEIAQTMDHRVLQLVHYARLGKRAEHNRKNAQRRIAEPPKKGPESRAAPPRNRSAEAMSRLAKTGSMADALKIDF